MSTSANPLDEIAAAACLWKLHAKGQLQLPLEEVKWLEGYLGSERVKFEIENDVELKAARDEKAFAAAALLYLAQCNMPVHGVDLQTAIGLSHIVLESVRGNLNPRGHAPGGQQQYPRPASSTSGERRSEVANSLLVSSADIVMGEGAQPIPATALSHDGHTGSVGANVLGNMSNLSAPRPFIHYKYPGGR
ncbi:hypothetical protein BN946_scf185016.g101 [Trametes cinnabarina]|uniref:Uncharacterized protein n=1 Tax=Pycnoporus cinnabarinus TaxID=5643 RepID=A0A060SNZ6_PYCCI|nr:hypothetical protein BN946_scf185016.g101 [Trametes cinnabarina]